MKEPPFVGAQIFTPINGEPLDMPKYMPIYEKMSGYDLPIWIHPYRETSAPDYVTEDESKYAIFRLFGWPYETSTAMVRLVLSGVFDRYPHIKFITHHCGAMIPYFAGRVLDVYESDPMRPIRESLSKPPIEYFQMFYGDTMVNGNTAALMCARSFFGAKHLLLGTDMPYGREFGERVTRETIRAINEMAIPESEKGLIFHGNAEQLLRLDTQGKDH
jgi:aminocarboxymuconate-semialdehyde decarboxylase